MPVDKIRALRFTTGFKLHYSRYDTYWAKVFRIDLIGPEGFFRTLVTSSRGYRSLPRGAACVFIADPRNLLNAIADNSRTKSR